VASVLGGSWPETPCRSALHPSRGGRHQGHSLIGSEEATSISTASAREDYDDWHRSFDEAEGNSPWHELVLAHLDQPPHHRILEIGCRRGGFAMRLAREQTGTVLGADFSFAAVAEAQARATARGIPNVEFRVEDIQDIWLESDSFDAVISCETIEHVPDPARAVRELARVLKPGGQLLLTTPNYLSLLGLARAYRRLTDRPWEDQGQPINTSRLLPRTLCGSARLDCESCGSTAWATTSRSPAGRRVQKSCIRPSASLELSSRSRRSRLASP
jgi:2-polyprenyl-3-methyl-5-hydroxy-6-metoxy-1,4-benzoquinol methylase